MMTLDEDKRVRSLPSRELDWEIAQRVGFTITTESAQSVLEKENFKFVGLPLDVILIVVRKDGKFKTAIYKTVSNDVIGEALKSHAYLHSEIPHYSTDINAALSLWRPGEYWALELKGEGKEPHAWVGIYHFDEGYPPSPQTDGMTLARAICFEFLNRASEKEELT